MLERLLLIVTGITLTLLLLPGAAASAAAPSPASDDNDTLWVLKPVVRPEAPSGVTTSPNPIDAFIAAEYSPRGLRPVDKADKRALLRRVSLDLTGLPPTPAEQQAFLDDPTSNAYEKVVDRLLASEQHGVRYARHWLDVLRYADADERMIAAPGLYLWRDWVIHALISLRRLILQECINLRRRRRQPGQVERDAAEERLFECFWRRGETFAFEPREDEAINWIAHPVFVFNFGQGRAHRRNESPVLFNLRLRRTRVARPRRALIYPASQQVNLRRRERLAAERHPLLAAFAHHAPHEHALFALTRHE